MAKKKGDQGRHKDMKEDKNESVGGVLPEEKQGMDGVNFSLEAVKKEAAENYDKYLRLAADFDNYKKRVQKDRADLLNYGNETLVKEILPIVDSLERALDHASNAGDFDAFVKGLNLILEQLRSILAKHGVEAIEAVGNEFDPNYHEAMMRVDGEGSQDNQVVEEFEKGYLLNGRLLRPSKVSVAKRQ